MSARESERLWEPEAGATLESVLCTEELDRRPSRPPRYEQERRSLAVLARALADSPRTILQRLVEVALDLCRAGSAGVSLLTEEGEEFFWPAIAGAWTPFVGGGTPRQFGPCGVVLDRDSVQLFQHPERYYPYLAPVLPPVAEALLTPFYVDRKAVGTVWVVEHEESPSGHRFDAEDMRLIVSLGRFASSAYQVWASLEASDLLTDRREGGGAAPASTTKEEAQRGEKTLLSSLSSFYDRYASLVYGLAFRILQDTAEAENVTQEVFLEVWREKRLLDPGGPDCSIALIGSTRTRAIGRARALRRITGRAAEGEHPPSDPSGAPRSAEGRRIQEALAALPREEREALELAYFGGYTVDEIAGRLGKGPEEVRRQLLDAMGAVRSSLDVTAD